MSPFLQLINGPAEACRKFTFTLAGRRAERLALQIGLLGRVVRRCRSDDRKAGTVTLDRLHLDTVADQIRGTLYNEQT
jgi:hypothetical protein